MNEKLLEILEPFQELPLGMGPKAQTAVILARQLIEKNHKLTSEREVLLDAASRWHRLVRKGVVDYEAWPPGDRDLFEDVGRILRRPFV